MRTIRVSRILWLLLVTAGCTDPGQSGLSELRTHVQNSKRVLVTFLDYSEYPEVDVPKQVNYEISSPSGMNSLIAGIDSMTDVKMVNSVAPTLGNPVLTIRGDQGEKLTTLEVSNLHGFLKIGNRRYTGTFPNTDFYHQLLDETLSLSDSAKQNAPPPAFQSIREEASQSVSWRIMVDDHPTHGFFQYVISDLAVIQQLATLMTSSDELKLTESAISVAPTVCIHIVPDKTTDSVPKIELGESDLHAIIAKQRYTVRLKSPELYQRLSDKNFEFPKNIKSEETGNLNEANPAVPAR